MAEARGTGLYAIGCIYKKMVIWLLSDFAVERDLRVLRTLTQFLAKLVSSWFRTFIYNSKVAITFGQSQEIDKSRVEPRLTYDP